MTAFALLFTLSAIGVSETVYLIRTRQHHEHPVCPIGEGCEVVLESKYNHIFGVKNDVLEEASPVGYGRGKEVSN